MPLIDMPIDELFKYTGSSPCPEDIDIFWDDSISKMRQIDPKISLIKSEFQAPNVECFDLYFTGVDNARIYAKYARPKNISGKCPAIVEFHGYSANSGDWIEKVSYAANGFCIASMDCRGQGGYSEDIGGVKGNTLNGHIIRGLDCDSHSDLLFTKIFLDAAQLAGIVMNFDEVDETKVGAMGCSQGGALTLACASLEPRISRLAPVYPFLCDYKRVWDMDLDVDAYLELKKYFRAFDPMHKREKDIFYRLGYIDLQNIVKRIKGEVLMFTGLMDTICPPSTQFSAYNKIGSKKDVIFFPDYGHEHIPVQKDITFQFMLKMLD